MPADTTHTPHTGFDPFAGLLAALLPGLGHFSRGEKKRGILAAAGVLGMFFGGLLVGGVDVIDSREDRWWFFGQALAGPLAFLADSVHQGQFKAWGPSPAANGAEVFRSGYPGEQRQIQDGRPVWVQTSGANPPNTKSLAKVNEIGALYVLCAGMLNLIVFLDALLPGRRGPDDDPGRDPEQAPGPTGDDRDPTP